MKTLVRSVLSAVLCMLALVSLSAAASRNVAARASVQAPAFRWLHVTTYGNHLGVRPQDHRLVLIRADVADLDSLVFRIARLPRWIATNNTLSDFARAWRKDGSGLKADLSRYVRTERPLHVVGLQLGLYAKPGTKLGRSGCFKLTVSAMSGTWHQVRSRKLCFVATRTG